MGERARRLALMGGLACTLSAGAASAQDWVVTIGGAAQVVPPYEGAGYETFLPVPSLQLRRPDRPDRPTFADDSPGLAVVNTGGLSLGGVLNFRGERNSSGDRAGLATVPLAVEPGLFASFWATDWLRLYVNERRGIRGDYAWTGDASLDLVDTVGRWTATVGPRVGWGDRRYMQTYFGVTPAEAAASPIIKTVYSPSAGARYFGGYGSLGYRIDRRWQVWANGSFHRLASQAADSPIVRQIGSINDFAGGVGVKYTFDWGG